MASIFVLGSGAFGLALAMSCRTAGHEVTVWSSFPAELDEIREKGESSKLPGVKIQKDNTMSADLESLRDTDVCICRIPSSFVRNVANQAAPYHSPNTVIVNHSKGLEDGTFKRMSEVLHE